MILGTRCLLLFAARRAFLRRLQTRLLFAVGVDACAREAGRTRRAIVAHRFFPAAARAGARAVDVVDVAIQACGAIDVRHAPPPCLALRDEQLRARRAVSNEAAARALASGSSNEAQAGLC